MSVRFNADCMACHLNRYVQAANALGNEETAAAFARELMKLYLSVPEDVSTPWIAPKAEALLHRFYDLPEDRFHREKEASNRFVLERLDMLRALAQSAADPVFAGLQLAVLGNYIDFAALQNQVSFEALEQMLRSALDIRLDTLVYHSFCRELSQGTKLLYLTDNAGEIGFDRVFAEQLQKAYPHLQITFCVRGGFAANDATRADAQAVGIPFPVIDNGNRVPGTELSLLSSEARAAMAEADVILSKGQGNAETLLGCGKNIYYAFLIKCTRFEKRFGKQKLTPMFVKEQA